MRDCYRTILAVLTGLLALWLIVGFWPLSLSSRVALSALVIFITGILMRGLAPRHHAMDNATDDSSLPPEQFRGTVILTCGATVALFGTESPYRETRQGWYLPIEAPERLPLMVQRLSLLRPALIPQISILLATLPEHHHAMDDFTQGLRRWQRALTQCLPWLNGLPPLWLVCWVAPPDACGQEEPVWFTAVGQAEGMQVCQPGQGNQQLAEWINEYDTTGRFSHLSQALWLDSLLRWQDKAVSRLLADDRDGSPAFRFCALGLCMVPVSGRADNLWQQHIADITALPPEQGEGAERLPFPDLLLSCLPTRSGISQRMLFWRYVGLLSGLFIALAMLASFINNQRFIRNVSDHLALYSRLSGEPSAPKYQAQQRLRADGRLLDDWQRRGEPLRYRMGLYQGLRLVAPVEAAIGDWAPIAPAAAVIKEVVPGPETLRLNSLSLFDPGRSTLKKGSTKMLVSSLVGIRAKPGWLIVISGHTDNTGNPARNQRLSLERAESVRDWMRDTGDLSESCFAVQGYGDSRPVVTNDTPEGRALNRRVEISLVPQADACQRPNFNAASPDKSDAITHEMEN